MLKSLVLTANYQHITINFLKLKLTIIKYKRLEKLEKEMMKVSYKFLFDVALILLSTKLFGLLTRKFHMPQVVGALIAGVVLGPAMFNILHETEFITQLSELGVIVLMFSAGLESDIGELKKTGVSSLIIAILGIIVPLVGGFFIANLFNPGADSSIILENIFIGIILTATSVSITAETLKELGKLSSRAGNAILGAAILDDIIGIIALTIITSLSDSTVNIAVVLFKIVLFFALSIIVGIIFHVLFSKWVDKHGRDMRRFVIIAFAFCLILSFVAEEFFGIADITGAFLAGLMLSKSKKVHYIRDRFDTISYLLLSPMFFASIGIGIELPELSSTLVIMTILFTIVAILTKIVGCGVGSLLCKYTKKESLQIGVGMVSRGEVALIVASKGIALGIMSQYFLTPIVIMVLVTTIITPILLKIVFLDKTSKVHNTEN